MQMTVVVAAVVAAAEAAAVTAAGAEVAERCAGKSCRQLLGW
jgi:hypothetical protein